MGWNGMEWNKGMASEKKQEKQKKQTEYSIYVIAGKDRYLSCQARGKLEERLLGKDRGLGLSVYDGKSVDAATVFDELHTLPFLSDRRVVVVDEAEKFITAHRELLEKYFSQPSSTGVLVLICDSWRSNTRLAKMLKGKGLGEVLSAEPMKGRAAVGWLTRQVRAEGKTFEPGAAESLARCVGNDTGRLASELEKLVLYVGNRKTIGMTDIEQLCGLTAEQSIFLINDLIAEGKTFEALASLDRLLRHDRSVEYSMVGVMAFSLRRLLKARALLDAGYRDRDLISACGIWPGMVERFIAQVRRFSSSELETMVGELAKVDYANKTGLGNVRLNLEKFIVCATAV